jgi:hypothetical protein
LQLTTLAVAVADSDPMVAVQLEVLVALAVAVTVEEGLLPYTEQVELDKQVCQTQVVGLAVTLPLAVQEANQVDLELLLLDTRLVMYKMVQLNNTNLEVRSWL